MLHLVLITQLMAQQLQTNCDSEVLPKIEEGIEVPFLEVLGKGLFAFRN